MLFLFSGFEGYRLEYVIIYVMENLIKWEYVWGIYYGVIFKCC